MSKLKIPPLVISKTFFFRKSHKGQLYVSIIINQRLMFTKITPPHMYIVRAFAGTFVRGVLKTAMNQNPYYEHITNRSDTSKKHAPLFYLYRNRREPF